MTTLQVDCLLKYDPDLNRLFAICKSGNEGVVVSANDHEVINDHESILQAMIFNVLNEIGKFEIGVAVKSKVEVVDSTTMRFILDSRLSADVIIYRKCDHCAEMASKFIAKATK